ncbi:MAG: folylpolyglutamate synthase/dihydrofolate synthase family protein [Geobacteraceae bacterium]
MTYQETLKYIYGLGRFGMRPGLEKINLLLHALGNPHNSIRTVHVAGTNGKGSTAAFLAAILEAGGYRAGLFTSPHLISFSERIRINGTMIPEGDMIRLAERVIQASPDGATFFEVVTAIAFLYFAEQKVDLAIMEVGMGGRLDATNAADGELAVITPVALDHCQYLGNSVAAIAGEKSGVIRKERPVVTAPQCDEALAVINDRCAELRSPLYRCGHEFEAEWEESRLVYRGILTNMNRIEPGIHGLYQADNAACALAAAELLGDMGFSLPDKALRQGINSACWPGRMEMFGESPRILLDGAHNPAAARALAEALSDIPRRRLLMVIGIMEDKDIQGILTPLLPLVSRVFAVAPSLERALSAAELASFCAGLGAPSSEAISVAEGLEAARHEADPEDLLLVCGSLFTVGEARALLLAQSFEPFRG